MVYTEQPFQIELTPIESCFNLKGKCQNLNCRKYGVESPLSLAFICKNCEVTTEERTVLFVLRATFDLKSMKQQLSKLYGYSSVC